jgi:hypothetical protein
VPQPAVSRILSAFARLRERPLDDHSSRPGIADGLKRPTRKLRTGRSLIRLRPFGLRRDIASLFGLAPCGVLPAICLTADAVRSYRTFSPLPFDSALSRLAQGGIFSVPLVLQVTLTGRYPAHCPAEFGLSSHLAASDRLAHCDRQLYCMVRLKPDATEVTRPSPAESRTARASCRGCCGASRSLRRSWKCSTRFRAAFQRARRARRIP